MIIDGGCLCGAVRYRIQGEVPIRALCLCRTCQKISGGAGNLFAGVLAAGFAYVHGTPASYSRGEGHPVREFCATCGTHLAARSSKAPTGVVVKAGTFDDPSRFQGPELVFWASEKQAFHSLPEGAKAFPTIPGADHR